ncbi:MAG: aldo/keto reductase [Halanaerobiaceae bacterium]
MEYKKLGQSGLEVSTISMGCWAIVGGSTWGPQDEEDAVAAIQAAYDSGINFFDTAEAYGDGYSEELLGKAVKDFREDIVIASKVSASHLKPEELKKSCTDSLRRLDTDYIDVYYIHWPNRDVPFADTLGALKELKQEGKIRSICCSNFGKNDLTELLKHGEVDANQLPYNLLFRAIEYEIQPLCVENDVSITCYSPIAQGLLTGKFKTLDQVPAGRARTRHFSPDRPQASHQEEGAEAETFAAIEKIREISRESGIKMVHLALSWLVSRKGVASVIVGARNPEQIKENARAAEVDVKPEILKKLTMATDTLRQKLGKNPDMWKTDSRYN